jgi:hypothetical protein
VLPRATPTPGPPYTQLRGPKAGPQLSLSRVPWAPNGHCLGAQRAPNQKAQGALGPPIKIISGNPGSTPSLGGSGGREKIIYICFSIRPESRQFWSKRWLKSKISPSLRQKSDIYAAFSVSLQYYIVFGLKISNLRSVGNRKPGINFESPWGG